MRVIEGPHPRRARITEEQDEEGTRGQRRSSDAHARRRPAAYAGEITGNQKLTPIKSRGVAASICAFSGLDDLEESPDTPWTTRPRRTQNYGQIPAAERQEAHRVLGYTPGQFCNPTVEFPGEPE